MLYQPTNITPNLINGLADGTVDATQNLDLTWQINGPSAMTKYDIKIQDMSADNHPYVYEGTGLTAGCPAYGKDNLGNIVMFSHTILKSAIQQYANGKSYQMYMRLYWGNTEAESVWLQSPVAFQTVAVPTFTAASHSTDITERQHTFDFLTFSDPDLQWFRWILSYNTGTVDDPAIGETIYDTGRIFGSGNMTMYYDGFLSGREYIVQCICCSANGIVVESDLYPFTGAYDAIELDLPLKVAALGSGSALKVSWTGANYIPGKPYGDYSISGGMLSIPTSNSEFNKVVWDEANEEAMSLTRPNIIVYRGRLRHADATLFSVSTSSVPKQLELTYTYATRSLSLMHKTSASATATALHTESEVDYYAYITAIVAIYANGTMDYWARIDYETGGAYPSETQYPKNSLYPRDSNLFLTTLVHPTIASSKTMGNISALAVYGKQLCDYLQVFTYNATLLNNIVEAAYTNGTYAPIVNNSTKFSATFTVGLDAGSLYVQDGAVDVAGWEIYRVEEGGTISTPLAVLPYSATSFCDYTARTDGTKYQYEVAPLLIAYDGTERTYTAGVSSVTEDYYGIYSPAYSLLECEYNDSMKCYRMLKEYDFALNLSTGSISNNNSPKILENFTRYPTIQFSHQNYMTGSLTSLIGIVNLTDDAQIEYSDTRRIRDELFSLSNTGHPLFLKTRKGDILRIQIAAPIELTTMDKTKEQALSATIKWVEVEDASNMRIVTYA